MALLKAEPPEPIRSLDELFAVAHRLECDAATQYAELAARSRGAGNADAADVFLRLAHEKRGHAGQVERWSEERAGRVPNPLATRWETRDLFGEEATEDAVAHRLATPYRVLSLAVRQEERTFVFWSYVVAAAEDPAVRQTAASMAKEALHRARDLRHERRRAFHAGRHAVRDADRRCAPPLGAASLERELAARLQELAEASAARGDGDGAHMLRQLAADSEGMAEEADEAAYAIATASAQELPVSVEGGTALNIALRLAELAAERYLAAAGAAKDEAVLNKAQSLAERAIARSAHLGKFSA